jgi:murein DD-endopeptidase MepM/ murein hydrolase activator NlpD
MSRKLRLPKRLLGAMFLLGVGILWLLSPDSKRIQRSFLSPISHDYERAGEWAARWPREPKWHRENFDATTPFYLQVQSLGLTAQQGQMIVDSFKEVFDFRRARPEQSWAVGWKGSQLAAFKLELNPLEHYELDCLAEAPSVRRLERPQETDAVWMELTLTSSLYEAFSEQPQGAKLASRLAELLAWDVDFFQDPRQGDRIEILVEARFLVHGTSRQLVEYGPILHARYQGEVAQAEAYRFERPDGKASYYNGAGENVVKSFLRSPLKFQRITSNFTRRRFHPILKVHRPHNGVDYGAPRNTPVMAVAEGTVVRAGTFGGAGKMVELAHRGQLHTEYLHLNGFGSGVRKGAKIRQGQVIGYVGKTGYATAEHLHFGMKLKGRYVDPLSQRFQPGDPLPAGRKPEFQETVAGYHGLRDKARLGLSLALLARK